MRFLRSGFAAGSDLGYEIKDLELTWNCSGTRDDVSTYLYDGEVTTRHYDVTFDARFEAPIRIVYGTVEMDLFDCCMPVIDSSVAGLGTLSKKLVWR